MTTTIISIIIIIALLISCFIYAEISSTLEVYGKFMSKQLQKEAIEYMDKHSPLRLVNGEIIDLPYGMSYISIINFSLLGKYYICYCHKNMIVPRRTELHRKIKSEFKRLKQEPSHVKPFSLC